MLIDFIDFGDRWLVLVYVDNNQDIVIVVRPCINICRCSFDSLILHITEI